MQNELTLRDAVNIVLKRKFPLLAVLLLAVSATMAVTLLSPPKFSAEAKVLVQNSPAEEALNPSFSNPAALARELSNEIAFAKSDTVLGELERKLDRDLEKEKVIKITAAATSDVLTIEASARTPEAAALLANQFASEFVSAKRAQALDSIDDAMDQLQLRLTDAQLESEALRQPITDLETQAAVADVAELPEINNRIAQLNRELGPRISLIDGRIGSLSESITTLSIKAELAGVGTAQIAQAAQPPVDSSARPIGRNLALGILGGVALAAIAAALIEGLDVKIHNAEDVRVAVNLPILASIPKVKLSANRLPLLSLVEPDHIVSNAYHRLRTAVEFSFMSKHISSILVTSASQSEGKTTTAMNLAGSLAAAENDTVLIEADLRRPRFHQVLNLPPEIGLTRYLYEDEPLENLRIHPSEAHDRLIVLQAGPLPVNPANTVSSPEFQELLTRVEKSADIVVIDAPPVLPVPDALQLAYLVDGVVIVAKVGSTKASELKAATDALIQSQANILGVVLVGTTKADSYGNYGYYSDDIVEKNPIRRLLHKYLRRE